MCNKQELAAFAARAFEIIVEACREDFSCLETRLSEFKTIKDTSETRDTAFASLKKTRRRTTVTHSLGKTGTNDFGFTIAAARRSEKRRLVNYVRMSDYMICDTLFSVLVESVKVRIDLTLKQMALNRIQIRTKKLQKQFKLPVYRLSAVYYLLNKP